MPFAGELSALLAASLWAVSSMIVAVTTARIGSVQVNITRLIIADFLLCFSIIAMNIPIQLSSSQVTNLMISGVIGLVFGDTFLFKAFQQIGARFSMLIMTLSPAISAILAYIFLGESLSLWGIIGIVTTLCGVSTVILERTSPTTSRYTITKFGLFCALLGALGQGGGVLFAKMAFTEGPIHGFVATFIRVSIAAIILLPGAVAIRRYRNPIRVFSQDKTALKYVLFTSFFGSYLGITFSVIAVAYTKVGIASTIIATSPVIMLPLVRIVHKEVLSWKATAGAVVAVGGVAMLFLT
jgi:drug/metabolite transporter (DMT)-like permease